MSKTFTKIYKVYLTQKQLDEWLKDHPKTPHYEEKVCTGVTCDKCGKRIPDGSHIIKLFTGHHAWGEESSDSFEWRELCSTECAQKYFETFKELIDKNENYKTDFANFEGDVIHYSELGDD